MMALIETVTRHAFDLLHWWTLPVTLVTGAMTGLGLGWLGWSGLSGFRLKHARALCKRTGELADEVQQRETHTAALLVQVQAIADAIDLRAGQARDDFEYRAAVVAKAEVGRLLFGDDKDGGEDSGA